ncbi:phosphatase PAP2 family protein [Sporofaciens sp. SGI.106]|uniref:phosphatase PAP2 family protein n=1 Tax=Sporofaciens sp. SGI.106 TaxID=3420568 RepID=UPI002A9DD352|nr:phosphatase PAP2 family protein [Lachnoclostridium sp.]
MKKNGKRLLIIGIMLVAAFAVWTLLIQIVDVQPVGQNGTDIGFATFNCWFHKLTGVHMTIYTITDWLGLVPLFICMVFGGVGFVQLVKRRSLFKVDYDIIFLGIYYVMVIFGYFIFEMIPINYRPILIDGFMESSYPSSTTLLVLSVMPTLIYQVNRRLENVAVKKVVSILAIIFSAFMVIGRLVSGVHWFTDILGSIMLSAGLFCIYKAAVMLCYKEEN